MPHADPEPFDPPAVYCRHLLVCRILWYDASQPDDGCSLGRIIVNVRPPAGTAGRFAEPRLFAYMQLFGEIGDYDVRLKLVQITDDGDGVEQTRQLRAWGPFLVPVTGLELVDSHAFVLRDVPFDGPGLYEFQLWVDGIEEPLAGERIHVPPVTEE